MECNENIKDLLPDYYLGQLSPGETEEVRSHLSENAACREALEEVAQVLDLVPFAVHTTEPPPELKEKVMSRVLSEKRETEKRGAEEAPAPIRTSEPASVRRRSGWRYALPLSAAALMLVALVGLTLAYVDLRQDNQQLQAEVEELQENVQTQEGLLAVAARGAGPAQDARGTAVLDPGSGALALDVYNLPTPPADHAYQAWLVSPEGDTLSLGRMEVEEGGYGQMTGEVSEPLERYESILLTVEPIGAERMSGPVYMEASL